MSAAQPFKPGDRVRRIKEPWADLKVGDEGVVTAATHDSLHLEGRSTGFMLGMFELVEPAAEASAADNVNHPAHYTSDPSGVECITITRHRTFNIGNAIKYLWRAGLKADADRQPLDKQIEDLRKAIFYITDEIGRLERAAQQEEAK